MYNISGVLNNFITISMFTLLPQTALLYANHPPKKKKINLQNLKKLEFLSASQTCEVTKIPLTNLLVNFLIIVVFILLIVLLLLLLVLHSHNTTPPPSLTKKHILNPRENDVVNPRKAPEKPAAATAVVAAAARAPVFQPSENALSPNLPRRGHGLEISQSRVFDQRVLDWDLVVPARVDHHHHRRRYGGRRRRRRRRRRR